MPLLTLTDVSLHYGLQALLDNACLQIEPGERVCVIGRNGAGKSTMLKLVLGEVQPEAGRIWRQPSLRIGYLAQDLPATAATTVFDAIAAGLPAQQNLLRAYHAATLAVAADPSPAHLSQLERLQQQFEADDGWNLQQRIDQIISRLQLSAEVTLATLSGGWRKRVALAQALVGDPELLILDEPTNHLDLAAIDWLEEQLLAFRGGMLFVTHDRALLQRLATRIVELDRGRLSSWPGDYRQFLQKKAAALQEEARHNALFDKKLAQEEVWIRQGIKARRTRNEGRVRTLEALRQQRRERRDLQGRADFKLDSGAASGELVINAEQASFAYQGRYIVKDLSIRIMRGDRVGIIGPNGAGKSTLLRLLLGELAPASGRVSLGTRLQVAYFDQMRAALDPDKSIIDNIAEGREAISLGGKTRHIMGYLQEFLFTPERVNVPVRALSGGECNRLMLARLFSQACNLLVMDEPTNDLDIETLELLEELLTEFAGTLLVVSHDRQFLDNIVTSTLVFEAGGRLGEYVGGYSDWLLQRPAPTTSNTATGAAAAVPALGKPAAVKPTQRKLGYNERRELDQLPARIASLEDEQARLHAEVSAAEFYQRTRAEQEAVFQRVQALEGELSAAYLRWDELESRANEAKG